VNASRNLARGLSVHLANQPDLLARALLLTKEFPLASIAALRGQKWAATLLHQDDAEALRAPVHVPTAICQRLTVILHEANQAGAVTDVTMMALDRFVQTMVDVIGGCERIHKTPLPFGYVVHLRRGLVIYCSTLPFALLSSLGWWSVLVTFAVSYVLLGIEEIGVEIEDPFEGDENDLPLEAITRVIQLGVGAFEPSAERRPT
jgi:putative membrane protein